MVDIRVIWDYSFHSSKAPIFCLRARRPGQREHRIIGADKRVQNQSITARIEHISQDRKSLFGDTNISFTLDLAQRRVVQSLPAPFWIRH